MKKLVIVKICFLLEDLKLNPEGADINDYEKISIRDKKGNINTLYRQRKKFEDLDDSTNFSSSWNIFKSHLN